MENNATVAAAAAAAERFPFQDCQDEFLRSMKGLTEELGLEDKLANETLH